MILKIQQENGETYLLQLPSAAVEAGKTRRTYKNEEDGGRAKELGFEGGGSTSKRERMEEDNKEVMFLGVGVAVDAATWLPEARLDSGHTGEGGGVG